MSDPQPLWWGSRGPDGKLAVLLDFPTHLSPWGRGSWAGKPPPGTSPSSRASCQGLCPLSAAAGSRGGRPSVLGIRVSVSCKDCFLTVQDKGCAKSAFWPPDDRIIKKHGCDIERRISRVHRDSVMMPARLKMVQMVLHLTQISSYRRDKHL